MNDCSDSQPQHLTDCLLNSASGDLFSAADVEAVA